MTMPPSAFSKMPTELTEECTHYLSSPELFSFRLVCRQAEAQTVRTVGHRLFRRLKTSLMGDNLRALEEISRAEKFAKYVKELEIEDDLEKKVEAGEERAEEMEKLVHIWPRNEAGGILAEEFGVANLATMLKEGRLVLDKLTIQVQCEEGLSINTEPVAALAQAILGDANLALTSLSMRNIGSWATEAIFHFAPYPDPRRRDTGLFSELVEANLPITASGLEFWGDGVLNCAPLLQHLELRIKEGKFALPPTYTPSFELQTFTLAHSTFPATLVQSLLSTSLSTLTSLTFSVVTLLFSPASGWTSLLARLAEELSALTHWELKLLSTQDVGALLLVTFPGLSKETVNQEISEGLETLVKGRHDNHRIRHVRFTGRDAGRALETVARYVRTG